ncbi:MAG TPA: CAP domain-containing protein [Methanospirillum sp.]|nr:CAP domain-containing protein [Methanospirillum sp.]
MKYNLILFLICLGLLTITLPSASAVKVVPNLSISQIEAPVVAYPGYPYQASAIVVNAGDGVSGIITVGFYLSQDDKLTYGDIPVGVMDNDPVYPGESVKLEVIDTMPQNLTPGSYRLYAVLEDHTGRPIDPENVLARLADPVQVEYREFPDSAQFRKDAAEYIFAMTNEARSTAGVSSLSWDEDLANLASAYSERMGKGKFFSHIDPDGNGAAERAIAYGYPTVKKIDDVIRTGMAENIAYMSTGNVRSSGYVDPTDPRSVSEAIMRGWMQSPGHRANILDPLFDRIGVGLSWNGEYWYATQEFF